jgi:hypothetical protein
LRVDEIARGRTAEEGRVPRERSKKEEEEEKTHPRSRGPAARPSTPPTSFFIFFSLTHAHTQTPPPGAPPAAPATDVRLITSVGSVRLPLLGLAVGGDTPAEAIEAGLGAGVARWEVRSEAAAARFGAALASAPPPPGGVAGLALTARIPAPASPEAALAAVDAILAAAGVGALALLLIEWGPPPAPGGPPRPGPGLLPAWAAAGAVVAAGKAAALGLADAGLADVEAVLAAAKEAGGAGAAAAAAAGRAPPPPPLAALQVEAHPALPQRKLAGVCRRLGVALLAAAPLAGGAASLLDHPVVESVAAEAGRTPAQVS